MAKLDEYRSLLEQGQPFAIPSTPEEEDVNFKYFDNLSSLKAEAEAEEALSFQPHPLEPADLPGDPEIQKFYSSAQAAGIVPPREIVNVAKDPPNDVTPKAAGFAKGIDVETVPEKAAVLDANLQGFDPAIQSKLLQVYKETLDGGGSKQDAYRRFLLYRQDTLRGPGETGWPEYPGGAPNEKFWDRYLEASYTGGFTDSPQTKAKAAKELYNMYRTKGIPKYTEQELSGTDAVSQTKQALHRLGFDGKGPLDPFDAFTAMQAFDRARVKAAGGDAERLYEARRNNLDFDLMLAAGSGAIAPLFTGTKGAVAGVATVLASSGIQSKLPEGTPDSVRVAIDFSLYGLGNRGSMVKRLATGAVAGVGAGAGNEAASAVGLPGIVGSFTGPVISPALAGAVKRQFQFVAERGLTEAAQNPERVQEALQKIAIDLKPDDIGSTVAIGDNLGVVDGLVGPNHLSIALDNGLQVTVNRDDVLYLPGMGKAATIQSEAARLRAGAALGDETIGVQLTPEAIDQLPLGVTKVISPIHFTPAENVESILRDGFIPTRAAPGTLPGVYVTESRNAEMLRRQSKVYGMKVGSGGDPDIGAGALFAEVPSGRVGTIDDAVAIQRELGLKNTAADMEKLAKTMQDRGFVGTAWEDPREIVYFNASSVKPKVSVSDTGAVLQGDSSRWDDFVTFAKGIMDGTARVTVTQGGGAGGITGLSPETNMLISAVTNNANDYRNLAVALKAGAKAKTLPKTAWGAAYLFAKSVVGMNPGARRIIQPAVFAASNYAEADQILIATRLFTLQKAVKEAFGVPFLENPAARSNDLLAAYKGPALTGAASDYVVGTLAHVIDQPQMYNLTSVQSDVIDLWQTMLRADAKVTEAAGVSFDLLEKNYIPYKRTETDPTFADRILAPATRGQGTGPTRPTFTKQRINRSLTEWADFLASKGEQVELDPFNLYLGRLQGAAKLRADQVFLRSVIKAHGVPIDSPAQEKALREAANKLKTQLSGKVATSIRQSVRNKANQAAFNKLDNLIAQTEKELARVDAKLFNTTGMQSPDWNQLEGMLKALDKEADLIATAAQQSNENLSLALMDHAATKKEIATMRDQLKGLQGRLKNAKRASAPDGWTEIGIGKGMGRRYAVPDEVAKEVNLALAPQQAGDVVAGAQKLVDLFRQTLLSVDGSFFTNQGYATAITDPVMYMTKFGSMAHAIATEEGFMLYMAQNLDAFTKYAQSGGTIYTRATDVVAGAGKEGLIDQLPVMKQVVKPINDFGYGRMLPVMKMMGWQTMNHMLDNIVEDKTLLQQVFSHTPIIGDKANLFLRKFAGVEGKSAQELMAAAADVMNNVGGGINYGKLMTQPSLASQLIFLTEGWMRANIGRIVTAAKVGDPAGVLARRWMFQNLAMGSVISTSLSLALSGRLPNYDPTAPDFLDIQVGAEDDLEGGSIPFLPGKTYIRAAFQGMVGVPWETDDSEIEQRLNALNRFGQGRTGQFIRLGADLIKGEDYLGRPINNQALYIGRNMLPVAIQNAVDNIAGNNPNLILSTSVGFAGLNFVPRNPYDARDAKVQEAGFTDPVTKEKYLNYGQLTDQQRAQFDKEHPEYTQGVVRWQEERDSPFAALRKVRDSHRAAVEALGKAFMGQGLSDAERALLGSQGANIDQLEGNKTLYRRAVGNLADFYREEAARIGQSSESFGPESTSQAIVSGYYTEVIDKSKFAGGLDYAVLDANERAYRRQILDQYGEDGIRVLDEELLFRSTDDPVAQAYHKDQQLWNPYFDYLDSFWKPENLTYAGLTPAQAEYATRFPNKEKYVAELTTRFNEQLVGKPLPDNIYKLKSSASADSIGKKWKIVPGQRLTEQQAQDIGEELVRIQLKKYSDLVGNASDAYLKQNTEALCAMSYWEIIEPSETMRPYLTVCDRGRVPGR